MNTHSIRKLIICLVMLLTACLLSHAQPAFPPTADESCNNCVPNGYTKLDNSYAPAISSPNYYGELISNWASYNGQNVPPPPSKYSQNLGYITHRFVTLQSFNNAQGNVQEEIQAVVGGFKPNKSYSFTYSVLSSAVPNTTFGKSAKMTVTTPPLGGGLPGIFITDQETTFGLQRNIWITKTLTFVASAETLVFTLSAGEMDAGSIGFVNFDIDNYPFACNAGSTDVPVSQTSVGITCPNNTFDLTTLVPGPPAGMENVWYTDAIHTDVNKVNDPTSVPVGAYYLFRYDPTFECFNVQQSNSKVEVKALGDISLKSETATNTCPETSVNLADQVNGPLPLSHIVRWFTTKDRSTQALFSPVVSTTGKYYAFLYNFSSGCYYKDIAEDSVDVTINVPCCQTGTEQVKLTSGNYNIGCGQTANLTSLLSANNNIPTGTDVVWYTTKNHAAGTIVNTPGAVTVGKYYAFIYDGAANCFNTDNSIAEVIVFGINGFQVPLDQTTLINQCPSKTVNLHNSYSVNPLQGQGFQIVFYKTADHTGGPVLANVNTTGTYYAFFFNPTTGCFNTDKSEAEVEVVIVDCTPCAVTGSDQVDLKTDSKSNLCPSTTVNLYSTVQIGAVPAGSEVVWFDNPYHWGAPLTVAEASAISASKTYYAFLHDIIDVGCYNTGVSSSIVNVTINSPCPAVCNAGTSQVNLKPGPATNACPASTVNLNSYFENVLPANGDLKYRWFDNASHTGSALMTPDKVSSDGFYYAFIYDEANDCYNTNESTSFVTVILQECKVYANIKVKLQGAMGTSADMHNNLRATGLLPTTDPYGQASDGPNALINNITDWLTVEIRSAANPANVLESKVFMLRTDGFIESYDGITTVLPFFKPQLEPVHILVKHRNHIAVMSKVIDNFTVPSLNYDFTTSLQQCYNDGSAPDQMTLVNGVWCMSAGELTDDETLDDDDNISISNSFHQGTMNLYVKEDLNMDGVVDDVDISLFNQKSLQGFILNYYKVLGERINTNLIIILS